MPTEVFEEPLEIEIGILESGLPSASSYPYPALTPTGTTQRRTFRGAILDNRYLRATFVPALGGRLLKLLDKRTGTELLHPDLLEPAIGGSRGAWLPAGIELHLTGEPRLTSMASVQFAAVEASEDQPGSLWLAEAVTGTGLSWHLCATMPEDRAELTLEARVFNRTFEPVAYCSGLILPSGEYRPGVVSAGEGCGLAIHSQTNWAHDSSGRNVMKRFAEAGFIAPRQLDTWRVSLSPFSGLRGFTASSPAGALLVGDDVVQLQVCEPVPHGKLIILTAAGQTLEAIVDLDPERIFEAPVAEPVAGVVLLDRERRELLRWEPNSDMAGPVRTPSRPGSAVSIGPSSSDAELDSATFDLQTRHIAHELLGARKLARGEFEGAGACFEQSLLYNAENHLAWWMKAMANRLAGTASDESSEILNAHYLAPLEPALRAESFLSQPASGSGPSPLVKPVAEHPEALIEVAALLVVAELWDQAVRWIEEALRHADLAMLRYLLAYCYSQVDSMKVEAADQVAAARAAAYPPYPWRPVERRALDALSQVLPTDERLSEALSLVIDHHGHASGGA